jgi:hypothetical protein
MGVRPDKRLGTKQESLEYDAIKVGKTHPLLVEWLDPSVTERIFLLLAEHPRLG